MKPYLCMFLALLFGRNYKKYCEVIASDEGVTNSNASPKYICLVCNCEHKVVGLRGDDREWFKGSLEANKRLRMTRQEGERKKSADAIKKQQDSLNKTNVVSKQTKVLRNSELNTSFSSLERWLA